MNMKQIFGQNLKRTRKSRLFTKCLQREPAYTALVRSVERGERNISLVNIATLARALDTPIAELFTDIITQKHEDAS